MKNIPAKITNKLRNNNEIFLNLYNNIEIMKENYLINKNINILLKFLENTEYENIIIKEDKRKYNKSLFEIEKKELYNVLGRKRNSSLLNDYEKNNIIKLVKKIYIPNNFFDTTSSIYTKIQIQETLKKILIIGNFALIYNTLNNKNHISLIKNNIEQLKINLLSELIESFLKFDNSLGTKFITYATNRMKMVITEFLQSEMKKLSIYSNHNYVNSKFVLKDFPIEKIDIIKYNIINNFNILEILNVQLTEEYDYKLTRSELLKIFNVITLNKKELILNNVLYYYKNIRNTIINEFKKKYLLEYEQILNSLSNKNEMIIVKKILDISLLLQDIETINEKIIISEELYNEIYDNEITSENIVIYDDILLKFKRYIGIHLIFEDIKKIIKKYVNSTKKQNNNILEINTLLTKFLKTKITNKDELNNFSILIKYDLLKELDLNYDLDYMLEIYKFKNFNVLCKYNITEYNLCKKIELFYNEEIDKFSSNEKLKLAEMYSIFEKNLK